MGEANFTKKIQDLEKELVDAKESFSKINHSLLERESEITGLKQKMGEQIEEHKEEISLLKSKISTFEEKIDALKMENKELKEKLKKAQSLVQQRVPPAQTNATPKNSPRLDNPSTTMNTSSPLPPKVAPPAPAPSLPSKSKKSKSYNATVKKKSVLTAIRGGVNLRKTKPDNAAQKMKKTWIPFNVDKITQRRKAMEETEDSESAWSDEE